MFEQVSLEGVKANLDHRAKNKVFLFHHEVKAKRNKKIKSKIFRRLLKKDKLKAGYNEIEMTPEAAKELAEKQEFKRAEVIIIIFIFLIKKRIKLRLNLLLFVFDRNV